MTIDDEQISLARTVAQEIAELDGVRIASVDDFNHLGNFQVYVQLKGTYAGRYARLRANLRKLTPAIKRVCARHDIEPFLIEHPEPQYETSHYQKTKKGYNRLYSMVHFYIRPHHTKGTEEIGSQPTSP